MGIKGLWQALREYVDDGHLSQFRGQRVAVDMYVWLHRCVHRCVRIRTDAVVAYLDAKYNAMSSRGVGGLHTTVLKLEGSSGQGFSGATGAGFSPETAEAGRGDAGPSPPSVPPPHIDDVIAIDDQFISLVLDKVSALQRFGVIPVCVFDGDEMPMKRGTDKERQERRAEAFHEALLKLEQLYCDMRHRRSIGGSGLAASHTLLPRNTRLYEEATQLLEKAVDISTELAHTVIQVLKEERSVECIVAPYEADAQLAYLCREGYVAAAASEDSDLIAYYCPCVISKLDTFSGKCEVLQPPICAPQFFRAVAAAASSSSSALLNASSPTAPMGSSHHHNSTHARLRAAALQSLHSTPQSPQGGSSSFDGEAASGSSISSPVSTTAFTYESFLLGCIMSGCDYVPNLRSIGIKKAFKLVANATSLAHVFATLEREYGFPREELARYRHRLLEAFYCFAHHLVYCPLRQRIVTFHPIPSLPSSSDSSGGSGAAASPPLKTELVGSVWEAQTAQDVCAHCLKDPCTLRLYEGVYQVCVTQYLQRTRRGQTSLKSYAGFQDMTSSKVVLHIGQSRTVEQLPGGGATHVKREREDVAEVNDTFGSPLKKHREASGFIGSTGGRDAHATAADGALSTPASLREEVVVVRSRFFMMRGKTAVCEQWSASSSSIDEHDGGERLEVAEEEEETVQTETLSDNGALQHDLFASHAMRPLNTVPHHLRGQLPSSARCQNTSTSSTAFSLEKAASRAADGLATSAVVAEPRQDSLDADGVGLIHRQRGSTTAGLNLLGANAATTREVSNTSPYAAASGELIGASTSLLAAPSADAAEGETREERLSQNESSTSGGSRHSSYGDRAACAAETPDVEPYTYAIAADTTAASGFGGSDKTGEGGEEGRQPTSPLSPPQQQNCACPFGYWQCNRAHSVFESCFLGKQWSREEGPMEPMISSASSTAPAPLSHEPLSEAMATEAMATLSADTGSTLRSPLSSDASSPHTSRGNAGSAASYVPRAFRPPRSTATASLPTSSDSPPLPPSAAVPPPSDVPASDAGPAVSAADSVPRVSVLHSRNMNADNCVSGASEAKGTASVAPPPPPLHSAVTSPLSGSSPPPPPLPSHRAAVRMAIFEQMAFKKA